MPAPWVSSLLLVLAGEAAIFAAHAFTGISFLWYNALGCLVVIGTGVLVSETSSGTSKCPSSGSGGDQ